MGLEDKMGGGKTRKPSVKKSWLDRRKGRLNEDLKTRRGLITNIGNPRLVALTRCKFTILLKAVKTQIDYINFGIERQIDGD